MHSNSLSFLFSFSFINRRKYSSIVMIPDNFYEGSACSLSFLPLHYTRYLVTRRRNIKLQ